MRTDYKRFFSSPYFVDAKTALCSLVCLSENLPGLVVNGRGGALLRLR